MLQTTRRILRAHHPETLATEALGLAALCVAIGVGLFLPVLA